MFKVVGEAPAGRAFRGRVGPGEAVRIFTGAPVPEGADRVVIQEDVTRNAGDRHHACPGSTPGPYVRPCGMPISRPATGSRRRGVLGPPTSR
jgi:molybdopterin molybdotransferase